MTPDDFIQAIECRFGKIAFDLAALASNTKAKRFFSPAEDSLIQDWNSIDGAGPLWLNPEFGSLKPWFKKAEETAWDVAGIGSVVPRPRWTLVLSPASVGSNWYAEHVHRKALVLDLNPRLQFVGHTSPYPKDLILSCYGFQAVGHEVWRWK